MKMKKILSIVGFACLSLFVSCEKETEGISFETRYATFELSGNNPFNLPVGTAYAEPGVKAKEGDKELQVTTSNNINHNKLGIYTVNYSATNSDGYQASTTRTVAVYNPTAPATDLSGTYVCDMFRTNADGGGLRTFNGLKIVITKVGPGIFYVDDLLGGYYAQGVGYGSAYAMTGYIALNADNSLTLLSSFVNGWGDGLEALNAGKYDPATGQITWKSIYASSRTFNVTLKK
jgi:hypothetical protein